MICLLQNYCLHNYIAYKIVVLARVSDGIVEMIGARGVNGGWKFWISVGLIDIRLVIMIIDTWNSIRYLNEFSTKFKFRSFKFRQSSEQRLLLNLRKCITRFITTGENYIRI